MKTKCLTTLHYQKIVGFVLVLSFLVHLILLLFLFFLLLLFLWFIATIILQLLNVYAPKFETGGKFWPIVHNSTIFSLLLMHVIAIGIFGLKKLPLASSLVIPLPVLTLLFNEYCRKRFLPIFEAYPTEVHWHNNEINPYRVTFYYKPYFWLNVRHLHKLSCKCCILPMLVYERTEYFVHCAVFSEER